MLKHLFNFIFSDYIQFFYFILLVIFWELSFLE
jgi:hypothetical protein